MNNAALLLKRLWREETGYIFSSDLILIGTILLMGIMVGLTTLRDQVVSEIADIAEALGHLNQSYSVAEFTTSGFSAAGSAFADLADFCEIGTGDGESTPTAGSAPGCINIGIEAVSE